MSHNVIGFHGLLRYSFTYSTSKMCIYIGSAKMIGAIWGMKYEEITKYTQCNRYKRKVRFSDISKLPENLHVN
jgi:hypothetical protein